MKVLFVIGVMGNGGAERVIANLSNEFVARGWEIRILTIYGSKQDYELDARVRIRNIICKCPIRVLRPFERMATIRRYIKQGEPDIVVSFLADVNIHVILSMLGVKKKLVVSERNDPKRDPKQKWMRWFRDRLYGKVDGIVFQTRDAQNYFDKFLRQGIKTAIIPNPIKNNLPFYNKDTDSNEFITACRLNTQKNLPLMIDAFKRLIDQGLDVRLSIYGEGPERKNLEDYIKKLNLEKRVFLCGFTNKIHDKMKNAACFVISSDYEGISNSMLEALAIGIPVVATDCPVGGARMYITDDVSGRLVPCGDVASLADAMYTAVSERRRAIAWGEKAFNIRNELTISEISSLWQTYLEGILEKTM